MGVGILPGLLSGAWSFPGQRLRLEVAGPVMYSVD